MAFRKGALARRLLSPVTLAVLAPSACAHHPPAQKDLLATLRDGVTTEDQVKARLGPALAWAGGSLWTYRVGRSGGGLYVSPKKNDWTDACCSLVLQFDPNGVLVRHALVDVDKPQ